MIKSCSFSLKELVSPVVYNYYVPIYGENFLWRLFDEEVLIELDLIKDLWVKFLILKDLGEITSSIYINTWSFGGNLDECGLRSNVDDMVKGKTKPYLSGHTSFRAFDLRPANNKIELFQEFIWSILSSKVLRKFKRMENPKATSVWCHIDTIRTESGEPEIFMP